MSHMAAGGSQQQRNLTDSIRSSNSLTLLLHFLAATHVNSAVSLHSRQHLNVRLICDRRAVDLDCFLTASARLRGSSTASWWSCTATWRRCIRTCWSTLPSIPRRPRWRNCSLISATSARCSPWVSMNTLFSEHEWKWIINTWLWTGWFSVGLRVDFYKISVKHTLRFSRNVIMCWLFFFFLYMDTWSLPCAFYMLISSLQSLNNKYLCSK